MQGSAPFTIALVLHLFSVNSLVACQGSHAFFTATCFVPATLKIKKVVGGLFRGVSSFSTFGSDTVLPHHNPAQG